MKTHWKAALVTALMLLTILLSNNVYAYDFTINGMPMNITYYKDIAKNVHKVFSIAFKIREVCPHVDMNIAFKIATSVNKHSEKHDIPAEFILSIIYTESKFKPKAKGSSGDTGLMQVIPRFHKERLRKLGVAPTDLKKIPANIKVGCDILAEAKDNKPNTYRTLWRMAKIYNGKDSYANKVMYSYKKLFLN